MANELNQSPKLFVLWVVLWVGCAGASWSQSTDRYVCITLESGVVRCGQLVADDGREITLDTPDMGKLILPKVNVIAMEDAPVGTRGGSGELSIELSDRMVRVTDLFKPQGISSRLQLTASGRVKDMPQRASFLSAM